MKRNRYPKCRHFTGVQTETCAVGISYESVRDETQQPYGFPCLAKGGTCAQQSLLTDEEEDARDREIKESFAKIVKAREAIAAVACPGSNGVIMPCPVCKGSAGLAYSMARSNGHIHAACSTEGCVRWME